MLISYSHKFIFIHSYNTAGASIKEALKEYGGEPEKFKINRPLKKLGDKTNFLYEQWQGIIYHAKAREIKRELPEEIYSNFYKFAFVRNPWARLVSEYHFIRQEPWSPYHQVIKSMQNFEEHIEWTLNARKEKLLYKDFVTDYDGKLIVDFVGRYETLEQDFYDICKVLNINASLPPSKNLIQRDYRTYYNEKTRKLIEDYLKEDIEFFGYTFENY